MIWRQRLSRSLHKSRSKAESRYFQFATVDANSRVQNRTVVFRGIAEESPEIFFVTDTDSDKYRAIQAHPQVELAWYFAKTREQYRMSGDAYIYDGNGIDAENRLRHEYWLRLSPSARAQFQPIEENSAPNNFLLIGIKVAKVDYLLLAEEQQRFEYAFEDGFLEHSIAP